MPRGGFLFSPRQFGVPVDSNSGRTHPVSRRFVMDPEAGIRKSVFRPQHSMYFETSRETKIPI